MKKTLTLVTATCLALSACAPVQKTVYVEVEKRPAPVIYSPPTTKAATPLNSMPYLQKCVAHTLEQSYGKIIERNWEGQGIAFVIKDVLNGTPTSGGSAMTRTNASKMAFQNTFQRLLSNANRVDSYQVILLDSVPPILDTDTYPSGADLRTIPRSGYGNMAMGLPDLQLLPKLKQETLRAINRNRMGDTALRNVSLIVVNASYSKFEDGKSKILGLTVNMTDPRTNQIIASERFEMSIPSDNGRGFRIAQTGSGLVTNFGNQEIKDMESARQALLDYASIWLLDVISPANLLQCGKAGETTGMIGASQFTNPRPYGVDDTDMPGARVLTPTNRRNTY